MRPRHPPARARRRRRTSGACSNMARRCARSPWIRRSSRRRAARFGRRRSRRSCTASCSAPTAATPRARCASTSSPASASRRSSGARAGAGCRSRFRASTRKKSSKRSREPACSRWSSSSPKTQWVWGAGVSDASWLKLTSQVTDLYERDYNNAWDALLSDLEIVPFSTVQQYADALGILAGPTSPLRGVLQDRRRQHVARGASADSRGAGVIPSLGTRITQGAKDILSSAQKTITGTTSVDAGHGRHAALPADPPADGRGARADRWHPRADSQDSGPAAQARSAGGWCQSAAGADRSGRARPVARVAAGRGEPAAAGQRRW